MPPTQTPRKNYLGVFLIVAFGLLSLPAVPLLTRLFTTPPTPTQNPSAPPRTAPQARLEHYQHEKDIFANHRLNVYFFWGEGCPHCRAQFAYLEQNFSKLRENCNFFAFETFDDHNNSALRRRFSNHFHANSDGVPFTVVGDEYLIGFSSGLATDLDELIERQLRKSPHIDLYPTVK